MDFGLIHLEISSSATRAWQNFYNINTSKIKDLVFNSDSEEHCTSNIEHGTQQ
jgi:hypothetical protein